MNEIILLMVLMGPPGSNAMTSFTATYLNMKSCKEALESNRALLSRGSVILATCTEKLVK